MVANVLPLRVGFDRATTFEMLYARCAEEMRESLRHQRYRGEWMLRDAQKSTPGGRLHAQNVNVMAFDAELRFGDYATQTHNLSNGPVDDLSITVYDGGMGRPIRIAFDANESLYAIEDLTAHRQRFLRMSHALAAGWERPVAEASLLTQAERDTLIGAQPLS